MSKYVELVNLLKEGNVVSREVVENAMDNMVNLNNTLTALKKNGAVVEVYKTGKIVTGYKMVTLPSKLEPGKRGRPAKPVVAKPAASATPVVKVPSPPKVVPVEDSSTRLEITAPVSVSDLISELASELSEELVS